MGGITKKNNGILVFIFVFVTFAMQIFLIIPASADMGPKPSIELTVIDAPDEKYYIDLLKRGNYTVAPNKQELCDQLIEYGYDPQMTKTICEYYDDGWVARLGSPLDDEITESNDYGVYKFDYSDVPYNFKIIIVTESGKIIVSDEFEREAYNAKITYNVTSGEIKEKIINEHISLSALGSLLCSYVITLFITLLIEGIVYTFKWFKFEIKCKRNIVCIILTNVFTQILLYVSINYFFIFGIFTAEIVILVTESIVYALVLKSKSRAASIAYAALANFASFFLGGLIGIAIFL